MVHFVAENGPVAAVIMKGGANPGRYILVSIDLNVNK